MTKEIRKNIYHPLNKSVMALVTYYLTEGSTKVETNIGINFDITGLPNVLEIQRMLGWSLTWN